MLLVEDIDKAFQISIELRILGARVPGRLSFLAHDVIFKAVFFTDESADCSNKRNDNQDDNAWDRTWLLIGGVHPRC